MLLRVIFVAKISHNGKFGLLYISRIKSTKNSLPNYEVTGRFFKIAVGMRMTQNSVHLATTQKELLGLGQTSDSLVAIF